jgi:hypothetical protein
MFHCRVGHGLQRAGFASTLLAVVCAISVPAGLVAGASPSITISTVGGQTVRDGAVVQPLSGNVQVSGTATTGGGSAVPPAKPLVADAGDSSFVAIGEHAPLLGSGYGGAAPYTFAWSTAAGKLIGADAPTAEFDTTGLTTGTYTVNLKVTDSAGATASDAVKVAVYNASGLLLLSESKNDALPGVLATGGPGVGQVEFPFTVPAGLASIDVASSWTLLVNDYDLHLVDPSGVTIAGPGESLNTPESIHVINPAAGAWKAVLDKFTTVGDTVTVKVFGPDVKDPRPAVSTTGPYKFLLGATQTLKATVSGGASPITSGWDTDSDGKLDRTGTQVTTALPEGRTLVTFKATDAAGFERRQTTSVLVGDADRLSRSNVAITVVGVADTGINPYHVEFSATTYPDPDVLALTSNFTRHPSEYIPGYPADAKALRISLGHGYYPATDKQVWDLVQPAQLYWIPGTKIIGAWDAGDGAAVNADPDATRILDDDGHGTGSSSVSVGNRYGYCPTCLLMFTESLDTEVNEGFNWVDITSHSFGTVAGVPLGPVEGADLSTKAAAERGQTVLFAAGNGVGNAFDVPVSTYGSGDTGNDWTITVGAIRRDNQRAIVGDGIPVEISAWGDGNLPSACRTGTVSQCAFGGTSAATPYTAGIFGTVLNDVRRVLGDSRPGQRASQVVAVGAAIPGSIYLDDGKLTRAELREAVLKTAFPLNQDNKPSTFPFPMTAPYVSAETNVLFEGYGAATPDGARRAVNVILGRELLPDRSFEDEFFAISRSVKDTLYGGYDRDGDGDEDSEAIAGSGIARDGVLGATGAIAAIRIASAKLQAPVAIPQATLGQNAETYYLHRKVVVEPGKPATCDPESNESWMDASNTDGDIECFENRVTSVPAAFRPLGLYPTDTPLDAPLPAGSDVYATIYVADENPAIVRPTGVLMATDREIGSGEGNFAPILGSGPGDGTNVQGNEIPNMGGCEALGELCWTKFDLSFRTTRPAFTGEYLTFQIQLLGARAWAFGHEGAHASKVVIVTAPMPPSGLAFGTTIEQPANGSQIESGSVIYAGGRVAFPDLGMDPTGAGDHPTERSVEFSIDDASFATFEQAAFDEASETWSARLGALADGTHVLRVRARMGTETSAVSTSTFKVAPAARVEWQVVRKNSAPDPARWRTTNGVSPWNFSFAAGDYGKGQWTIVTRLIEGDLETARASVRARLE